MRIFKNTNMTTNINILLLVVLMLAFQNLTKLKNILIIILILNWLLITTKPNYSKKLIRKLFIFFFNISILCFIQIIYIKNINLISNIYFYITVYVGILVFLCIRVTEEYKENYTKAVIITLVYYNITTVYLYSQIGYSRGVSSVGTSINYLGALNLLMIPYIFFQIEEEKKQAKKISKIYIVGLPIIFLGMLLSGSRAVFITFLVVSIFLKKILKIKIDRKKILMILLFLSIFMLIYPNVYIKLVEYTTLSIKRVVSTLSGEVVLTDRYQMKMRLKEELEKINILIGKGDSFLYDLLINDIVIEKIVAHNFFYEILLHSGLFGLILFINYYFTLLFEIYIKIKKNKKARHICNLIIFSSILMSLSQPFLTTGLLFNYILFNNIYIIYKTTK